MARAMKQRYHTIIKLSETGTYLGWVEEIPGALTHGRSLEECRRKLRDALQLMIETHRDEARLALDPTCIQESIELDLTESHALESHAFNADVMSVGSAAASGMSQRHF